MSSGLAWHPRHPDRQRPLRREDAVVQYSEPSPPTYVDEAEVLPGEVAAVEREFADAPTRRADADRARRRGAAGAAKGSATGRLATECAAQRRSQEARRRAARAGA